MFGKTNKQKKEPLYINFKTSSYGQEERQQNVLKPDTLQNVKLTGDNASFRVRVQSHSNLSAGIIRLFLTLRVNAIIQTAVHASEEKMTLLTPSSVRYSLLLDTSGGRSIMDTDSSNKTLTSHQSAAPRVQ